MSAQPLSDGGSDYIYDFTDDSEKAYGGGQTEIKPGIWGMVGGDGDRTGFVEALDKASVWDSEIGEEGYLQGDYNLNRHVSNPDKNDVWLPNLGAESQIPE